MTTTHTHTHTQLHIKHNAASKPIIGVAVM